MKGALLRLVAPDADGLISYSRNFADVILHRLFRDRAHGFFLDVGPGHPRHGNDLYALYRRGWNGINVEPDADAVALLRQLRPRDNTVCAAVSDTAERGGERQATTTLADLQAEWAVGTVDVLRVDAGGAEEQVLAGNDWDRFRPTVVLLGAVHPGTGQRRITNVRGFMEQRGYRHALFDGLSDFYLELGFQPPDGLALPPNVFDRFTLDETVELRRQVAAIQQEAAGAADHAAGLARALETAVASQDEAVDATGRLAEENRGLAGDRSKLASENRRLRSAAEQMRAELAVLSRLLAPLHDLSEQMERQRRSNEADQDRLRAEMERQDRWAEEQIRQRDIELRVALQRRDKEQQVALQQRDREMDGERHRLAMEAEAGFMRRDQEIHDLRIALANVYRSTSWTLTKPWRGAGRLLRRLTR